jgi:hypothetical protein
MPIRPVVIWQKAPAYKLTKWFSNLLPIYIPLPIQFNIKKSVHLMNDLIEITVNQNLRFVSFDIENMYTNIPTSDLIEIIKSLSIDQGHNSELTNELINITHTILRQNYFQSQSNFYIQKPGLAVGAPTSPIFSEVFLEHIEHKAIYDILIRNKIFRYFRYVDDILIAYNDSFTNIHEVFDSFNNMVPTLKFTMENEVENRINFRDITIQT